MTNEERAESLTGILNTEFPGGLKIEYVQEQELTDAELTVNDFISIQFQEPNHYFVNTWDGKELSHIGNTSQRYGVVDIVKGILGGKK